MKSIDYGGIPTSLGEIINIKYHFDLIKNDYSQIKLSFHKQLLEEGLYTNKPDWGHKKQLWEKYLNDIGNLFFSEPPYVLEPVSTRFGGDFGTFIQRLNIVPQKVEMANLLCKGTSLNLGEEYIVITTKVRQVNKIFFYQRSIELWKILRELSRKYKIVILGERLVEMRKEYANIQNEIFGIYEQIIANIPKDRIVDLTVPALGETVSDLTQIQQDCLIMNEAKFVITIGVGGNSCMAHATSKMSIGFRSDNLPVSDIVFSKEYSNCVVTKDWNRFTNILKSYLYDNTNI